jgi:N-acetyl-anhydromuramyl-L-alanine amidase AmpD
MELIPYPSPNYFTDGLPIEAIGLHGTAGRKWGALSALVDPRPAAPDLRVSSNYLVDYAGLVYHLVDEKKGWRAFANGNIRQPDMTVRWLVHCLNFKINPNLVTVSIEHEALDLDMRQHKSMPDAQFNSSIELTAAILTWANLKANHETIVAHCQIDSVVKANCPGVIFVPAYLEVLLLRHPELR